MKKSGKLSVGLIFDDSLDSSDGVAQYIKTLGAWLTEQGHEVTYLVGQTKLNSWAGGRVYSLSRNFKVTFNSNRLSIPLPTSRRRIKQVVGPIDFDVVHVMMPHSPLMAQKVIDSLPARIAVIGTFHVFPSGWLSKAGGRLLSLWYGRKIRRFDQIVSVSPAAKNFAAETFRIESDVLPNPVDLNKFNNPPRQKNKSAKIVFLGRLVPRKGCSLLLSAFAAMKNGSARLTIAGQGPQRAKLEKQARKLGISNRVNFVGFIDEAKKPGLLAGADIACFPSLYGESFGIVLIEAMAAGAGVVLGGDNPGYRSVLGEQPALLVDPNDTKAFAERLDGLLASQTKRAELHEWQKNEVGQYDINKIGAQLVNVYVKQIAKRSKKGNN